MHALTSLPPSVLTRILDHLSASLPAGRRTEVLLLACLIAPALVEPSRRLLSREVSFSHRDGRRRLAKLRDTGALPAEWRPRRLAFSVIDAGEARELLGRAEEVEELRLEYVQALRVLDCGPGVTFPPSTTLPPRLVSLHLASPYPPPETLQPLLASCTPTLRSLQFLLSSATSLQHLLDALTYSYSLPLLSKLSITNAWLFDGDAIPTPLTRIVASCTSLAHLRLEGFSLLQLAPILRKVGTQLTTVTFEDMVGDGTRGLKRAGVELGARLRECSKAPSMRGLREWRLHVPEAVADEWRWKEDWIECQAVCEVRGTQIVWIT